MAKRVPPLTSTQYLPPKELWTAKLEEISQIRHRVAHFRVGHTDDYRRLRQFLRDIDEGLWRFCTSYNDPRPVLPAAGDPVVSHFLRYDPFPWTEVEEKKWARLGMANPSLVIAVTVELLQRRWAEYSAQPGGKAGYIYDVNLTARRERNFDYLAFLERTRSIHSHIVHLCLSEFENHIRLTIPSVLGSAKVIELVDHCFDAAASEVRPSGSSTNSSAQDLADEWPEYVLGPKNPLTFLAPGMKCAFFAA
jgi:hypothetical protein